MFGFQQYSYKLDKEELKMIKENKSKTRNPQANSGSTKKEGAKSGPQIKGMSLKQYFRGKRKFYNIKCISLGYSL